MTVRSSTLRYPTYSAPPLLDSAAGAISHVASPPLLSVATVALGSTGAAGWGTFYALLAVVLPTLHVIWMLRRGLVSDLHLRVRSERIRPLRFSVACGAAGLAILQIGGAPPLLVLVAVLNLAQLALFLGMTLRWKVSAHCASSAALAVLGCYALGTSAVLLWMMVPVIAWARIHLRRHTPAEALAGALLGVCLWGAGIQAFGG